MGMERSDDVRRNIESHLSHGWRRKFLCTKQEVRESILASLLGIRMNVRSGKTLSVEELHYQRTRCEDVRAQLRVLMERGDRHHVVTLLRILRSFERTLATMAREDYSSDPSSDS